MNERHAHGEAERRVRWNDCYDSMKVYLINKYLICKKSCLSSVNIARSLGSLRMEAISCVCMQNGKYNQIH